jgi:hypothetical protein
VQVGEDETPLLALLQRRACHGYPPIPAAHASGGGIELSYVVQVAEQPHAGPGDAEQGKSGDDERVRVPRWHTKSRLPSMERFGQALGATSPSQAGIPFRSLAILLPPAESFMLVLTARLSGHQVMINGHALPPPLSFMAAVPVGPEPRSLAGGRLELLETATTVTECDWMRSYGRA